MKKIYRLIARVKIYFTRSAMYMSIINFLLLLATFKATYDINISVLIIAPVGLLIVLIIGYIDYSLIMDQQIQLINKKNDIKSQLSDIEIQFGVMNKKIDKIIEGRIK